MFKRGACPCSGLSLEKERRDSPLTLASTQKSKALPYKVFPLGDESEANTTWWFQPLSVFFFSVLLSCLPQLSLYKPPLVSLFSFPFFPPLSPFDPLSALSSDTFSSLSFDSWALEFPPIFPPLWNDIHSPTTPVTLPSILFPLAFKILRVLLRFSFCFLSHWDKYALQKF